MKQTRDTTGQSRAKTVDYYTKMAQRHGIGATVAFLLNVIRELRQRENR